MKKTVLSVLAVFVTWLVFDYIIHGLILGSIYTATPQLWRPMDEMKTGLLYFTVLVAAAAFVMVYDRFFTDKSIKTAATYGLIFGIGTGISMGYGTYSVMPVPYSIALVWFLGTVVRAVAGGLVAAAVMNNIGLRAHGRSSQQTPRRQQSRRRASKASAKTRVR